MATSGRTQREIAEDLGFGLSTLVRWIVRSRDCDTGTTGGAPPDMAAEVERLRRKVAILRQERDVLSGQPLFSPGRQIGEVPAHRPGEEGLCGPPPLPSARRQPERLLAKKDRPASRRQRDDRVMLAHVRSAFAVSNGTHGSPRMTRELQDDGFAIGRRRTAQLMCENGLRARQKRRFKRTTDREHAWPIAPNIINQDFTATASSQKWGVDISYIWTREGWLYLAVVIDLFSRRVVGWAVGDRLNSDLALAALRKALVMRRPPEEFIHHSDRGTKYCSVEYQTELPWYLYPHIGQEKLLR